MLKKLHVQNFAIIKDISVDFNDNMTVLTGETGAGKSLVIDSILLLLGSRADSDMIRYHEDEATIEGVFDTNPKLDELLDKFGINKKEDITIFRQISNSSKNVIKINNQMVSLQNLKELASYLADIHVQNDTYMLFDKKNYLSIIDSLGDEAFKKALNDYTVELFKYNEAYKEFNHILNNKNKAIERLEYLEFERDELEALDLTLDCDIELEQEIEKLSNYDKIYNGLSLAYNNLENELDPLSKVYDAAKALEDISSFDKNYEDYSSKLLDTYYISSDIKDMISKDLNNLDFDQNYLNSLNERLDLIDKAKQKYNKSVNELIEYLKKITLDIEITTNYDEVLREKENELKKIFNSLEAKAIKLSDKRKKIAKDFSLGLVKECKDLDLDNTKFDVLFNDVKLDYLDKDKFLESGIDDIDFLISFNIGEALKPLYKVASGGEASRLMLALKSYLKNKLNVNLFIFDEIDTGVSGSTAKKIANKMAEIAKDVQVICITHLPQVAAIAKYHKFISKEEIDGRTYTAIKNLDYQQRVEEIALMLSGDKISSFALEHAKNLLNN